MFIVFYGFCLILVVCGAGWVPVAVGFQSNKKNKLLLFVIEAAGGAKVVNHPRCSRGTLECVKSRCFGDCDRNLFSGSSDL